MVSTIKVHYSQTLQWALGAPVDLRNAFLYLLSGTVSIQYLVLKQQLRFSGKLEHQLLPTNTTRDTVPKHTLE